MANALASCVSSLRSSNALLSSSVSILDTGVNDFPRLAKVLKTTRHFELLPNTTLSTAQASLLETLSPEISSLLTRVETYLDRLERREQALIARNELLRGRLSRNSVSGDGGGGGDSDEEEEEAEEEQATIGRRKRIGVGRESREGEGGREALRLKQMRGKKERLAYTVERLALQAQQRERQLRMSVAAQ